MSGGSLVFCTAPLGAAVRPSLRVGISYLADAEAFGTRAPIPRQGERHSPRSLFCAEGIAPMIICGVVAWSICRRPARGARRQRRVVASASSGEGASELGRRAATCALVLATQLTCATSAAAEDKTITSLGDQRFHVDLPQDFTFREKGIMFRINEFEQRSNANDPYGKWVVGVTVDAVLANSLADVGTAAEIGEKILKIERKKDGLINAEVLAATRATVDGVFIDVIEYRVETTRGFNHFLNRVALVNGKLYTLTSQCPEDQWPTLEKSARAIIESFRLTPV
mmetsp:Transcript_93346/g.237600  ORF Transcript_93346/g.237600 Transcript_93346/m.237600 type:complete len:283 (+) Transcript_93346:68-916(+)